MAVYNFKEIEEKWRATWDKINLFKTPENPKKKYYLLEMYAYTSGDIHMGHFRNYTIGDVVWRYKKMKGYDILHPFGWDAFGLPAEEAAIKRGVSPKDWTYSNIKNSRSTLKRLGISYDWKREVITADPKYYKWTQWLFIKLYENGLVYRKSSFVNWCENCKTVLANEQVIGGKCWRCNTPVIKKEMEQWYIKITAYSEELLEGLNRLDGWPENVKIMQRNWIGKSVGTEIDFETETGKKLSVFTTRADTIFGVTFMSVAPEHPFARSIVKEEVKQYIHNALLLSEIDRTSEEREKTGAFSGKYAIHPITGKKIPIFIADYVLSSYGTGAVMGVPAHDQRDFEFAKKYNLPIHVVVRPIDHNLITKDLDQAFEGYGIMTNSGEFSGLKSEDGMKKVTEYLEKIGKGRPKTSYKLRDWLVSRQRYWGAPIPMIHCDKCGVFPVDEKDLPVLLPDDSTVNFLPTGRSPLADSKEFYNIKCPLCGGPAHRDPDTMDTFVDSAWYNLRYYDPNNDTEIFDKKEANKWHPIDLYIGGVEHATGHLIYFRFINKFLYKLGFLKNDEPSLGLFNHGMVLDENGDVMSKSKGNVISPVKLMDSIGVDAARIAMLFSAPPEREILWSAKGVRGAERFLDRVYRLLNPYLKKGSFTPNKDSELYKKIEETVRLVTIDIENMKFNTAIAFLMECLNTFSKYNEKGDETYIYAAKKFTLLLGVFAPFIAEELYEKFGTKDSVFLEEWPEYDKDAVKEEEVTIVVQVNGKLRGRLNMPAGSSKESVLELAKQIDSVKKFTTNREFQKVIFVPDRILNIVVSK